MSNNGGSESSDSSGSSDSESEASNENGNKLPHPAVVSSNMNNSSPSANKDSFKWKLKNFFTQQPEAAVSLANNENSLQIKNEPTNDESSRSPLVKKEEITIKAERLDSPNVISPLAPPPEEPPAIGDGVNFPVLSDLSSNGSISSAEEDPAPKLPPPQPPVKSSPAKKVTTPSKDTTERKKRRKKVDKSSNVDSSDEEEVDSNAMVSTNFGKCSRTI